MSATSGMPVVLTADRTLIASYAILFDGMLAASQTSLVPAILMDKLLMPPAPHNGPAASVAPLGLRRIEAALLVGGMQRNEVIVADPAMLEQVIGSKTRIIGISSGEPAGHGMNTSTMCEILGGNIYPEKMFLQLVSAIKRLRLEAPQAKVILGGPGAWQVAGDSDCRKALGLDHVVLGYAEGNIAELFQAIIRGEKLPEVIIGEPVDASRVPCIRGASTMGVVEISRGCGLGCAFCTIRNTPMIHLPPETIEADVRTNIEAGQRSIAALSEDFFRYGAAGINAQPDTLIALLERLRRIPDLKLIQIDHCNVISIAQYTDEQLSHVKQLLTKGQRHRYPWVNVGVETASGELLKANGGGAKIGKDGTGRWPDLCREQMERLCAAGFFPMVSLVVGLPGETEEDAFKTLEWVRDIRRLRISVFPVLFAPVDGSRGIRACDMSPNHWRLMQTAYNLNFKWIPRMYWDNQTGAGVPLAKRLLLQGMGNGQVAEWKTIMAYRLLRSKHAAR